MISMQQGRAMNNEATVTGCFLIRYKLYSLLSDFESWLKYLITVLKQLFTRNFIENYDF